MAYKTRPMTAVARGPMHNMGDYGSSGDGDSELEFKPTAEINRSLNGVRGTAEVDWERKQDGSVCITAINGHSVTGVDDGDEGPQYPEESSQQEGESAPQEA